jgi:hypothetical protein
MTAYESVYSESVGLCAKRLGVAGIIAATHKCNKYCQTKEHFLSSARRLNTTIIKKQDFKNSESVSAMSRNLASTI